MNEIQTLVQALRRNDRDCFLAFLEVLDSWPGRHRKAAMDRHAALQRIGEDLVRCLKELGFDASIG